VFVPLCITVSLCPFLYYCLCVPLCITVCLSLCVLLFVCPFLYNCLYVPFCIDIFVCPLSTLLFVSGTLLLLPVPFYIPVRLFRTLLFVFFPFLHYCYVFPFLHHCFCVSLSTLLLVSFLLHCLSLFPLLFVCPFLLYCFVSFLLYSLCIPVYTSVTASVCLYKLYCLSPVSDCLCGNF
jgi:hypothetical protein